MSDLDDVIDYILAHEAEDFEEHLCERWLEPYKVSRKKFEEAIEDYTNDPTPEKLDWLAEHSAGHVYCSAVRLSCGR